MIKKPTNEKEAAIAVEEFIKELKKMKPLIIACAVVPSKQDKEGYTHIRRAVVGVVPNFKLSMLVTSLLDLTREIQGRVANPEDK